MTRLVTSIASIFFFAATIWPAESLAQRRSRFSTELSSLTELRLTTGGLDTQGCGVTTEDLDEPARTALAASRIQLLPAATSVLFAEVNAVVVGDSCAAAVEVALSRWSSDYGTAVTVWSRKGLTVGARDGFNGRVRETVDRLTKEFISDWLDAKR